MEMINRFRNAEGHKRLVSVLRKQIIIQGDENLSRELAQLVSGEYR